jgi:hypothetical protein
VIYLFRAQSVKPAMAYCYKKPGTEYVKRCFLHGLCDATVEGLSGGSVL